MPTQFSPKARRNSHYRTPSPVHHVRSRSQYDVRGRVGNWHCCCPYPKRLVMNVTALVLLLTLAGSPMATLACVSSWCSAGPMSPDACHEGSALATPLTVADADNRCAGLFATSPFMNEESQELKALAAKANTPADYKNLEEYFLTLAKRYTADANDHVAMAQAYRGTKIAQSAAHCDRLVTLSRDAAKGSHRGGIDAPPARECRLMAARASTMSTVGADLTRSAPTGRLSRCHNEASAHA